MRSSPNPVNSLLPGHGLSQSLRLEPPVKLLDPVIAGCPIFLHTEAVAAAVIDMRLRLGAGRRQCVMEFCNRNNQVVVLRPRRKDERQPRRNRRYDAEGRVTNQPKEIRASGNLRLQQHSDGSHRSGREAHESNPIRRDSPVRSVLPDNLQRLNSVGDSVLKGLVEIHVVGTPSLFFPMIRYFRTNAATPRTSNQRATSLPSRSIAGATDAPLGAMTTPVPVALLRSVRNAVSVGVVTLKKTLRIGVLTSTFSL